jgi:hypothetical protein
MKALGAHVTGIHMKKAGGGRLRALTAPLGKLLRRGAKKPEE